MVIREGDIIKGKGRKYHQACLKIDNQGDLQIWTFLNQLLLGGTSVVSETVEATVFYLYHLDVSHILNFPNITIPGNSEELNKQLGIVPQTYS